MTNREFCDRLCKLREYLGDIEFSLFCLKERVNSIRNYIGEMEKELKKNNAI